MDMAPEMDDEAYADYDENYDEVDDTIDMPDDEAPIDDEGNRIILSIMLFIYLFRFYLLCHVEAKHICGTLNTAVLETLISSSESAVLFFFYVTLV